MTDGNQQQPPHTPPIRQLNRYAAFKAVRQEIMPAVPTPKSEPERQEVFTVTFTATQEKGVSMDDEKNFVIDLIFKPNEGKLRLRPQETQLLLAYYAELLQEITDEEQAIIEDEKAANSIAKAEK
jgi:hypothetical protein